MKSIMLASAAMLSFAAVTGVATAQETPAPMSQPPAGDMAPPADPAAPADCECGPPTCKYCKLHVEKEKIKKSCWKVERKQICIPEVRFPWSKLHACRHHGCRGCAKYCPVAC